MKIFGSKVDGVAHVLYLARMWMMGRRPRRLQAVNLLLPRETRRWEPLFILFSPSWLNRHFSWHSKAPSYSRAQLQMYIRWHSFSLTCANFLFTNPTPCHNNHTSHTSVFNRNDAVPQRNPRLCLARSCCGCACPHWGESASQPVLL